MVALMLVLILIALGVASYLGATPDSRDTEYSLGPVIRRRGPA